MSNSAINQGVLQAKINNVQNQADSSAVYSAGAWSFKNASAVTSVQIDNSGNVGIGATSVSSKLDVQKDSAATNPSSDQTFPAWTSGAVLKNASATDGAYSGLSFLTSNLAGTTQGFSIVGQSTASGFSSNLLFMARTAAGTTTERMRIDASGNLLVGTTNTNPIVNGVSGTKVFSLGVVHSNASSVPSFEVGRYTTTGNMMTFYYGATLVGNISTNGSTITFSGNAVSDVRWKENISAINNALSIINRIEFIEFDYKENKQKSAGVTAQQLQTIPELSKFVIDGSDEESYKAVDYNALIGYLGKAIQELSAKVDAQAAEIEALKAS